MDAGAVFSWGGGKEGQLGNGEQDSMQPIPRQILKFHALKVTMICAGADHSLAVGEGGVYSWGKGANGRLGLGDTNNRYTPTPIKALYSLYRYP